jgi:hypothetical protein
MGGLGMEELFHARATMYKKGDGKTGQHARFGEVQEKKDDSGHELI